MAFYPYGSKPNWNTFDHDMSKFESSIKNILKGSSATFEKVRAMIHNRIYMPYATTPLNQPAEGEENALLHLFLYHPKLQTRSKYLLVTIKGSFELEKVMPDTFVNGGAGSRTEFVNGMIRTLFPDDFL